MGVLPKLKAGLPRHIVFILFFTVLFYPFQIYALKVTVDADGGANYTSLNQVLAAMRAGSISPDTVEFIGNDQDTYIMSEWVNVEIGTLYFIGRSTDPDNFPVINHTSQQYMDFFSKNDLHFERIIFTGTERFDDGDASGKVHSFTNCIIRDVSAYGFVDISNYSHTFEFVNCLFVNNALVFSNTNWLSNKPVLRIINCTFDGNTKIFNSDVGQAAQADNFLLRNCIFSNTGEIPANIKPRVFNSLISEAAIGNYGTGCVFSTDPEYASATPSIPSDWKPRTASPAREIGTSTGAPPIDLAGEPRGALIDAGCFIIVQNGPPEVKTQPRDTVVGEGAQVRFSVVAAGTEPLSYVWFKTGSDNPVGSEDNLVISSVTLDDSGAYFCVISNDSGSVSSESATLRVITKPEITVQPLEDIYAVAGDPVTISVVASGELLTYTWLRNGSAIPGANTASLELTNITLNDDGRIYRCVVSNIAGTDSSIHARLHVVEAAPKIILQPKDTTVVEGASASFTVAATGKSPFTYTWYKVGTAESVGTGAVFMFEAIRDDSGAAFFCIVSNAEGEDESEEAILHVTSALRPRFTSQPRDVDVREGQEASFTVAASGSEPMSFTWYKDDLITEVGTGLTLTFAAAEIADSGYYRCIVSNINGADTSNPALLRVVGADEVYNPITLHTTFIDRGHVLVTIENFSSLPSQEGVALYADAVGVWYQRNMFPVSPQGNASDLLTIPLATLLASGLTSFDTLVSIGQISEDCDSIYFAGSVFWHNPDTIPSFVRANGAAAYMCAENLIENNLELSGDYIRGEDSIVIHMANLNSLDRDSLLYLISWYTDSHGNALYDTIYPDMLPELPAEIFTKVYRDALFAGEQQLIQWQVIIRGTLGNYSDTGKIAFLVGFPRPENNAELLIDDVQPTLIELSWTVPPTDLIDSVRIWWGTDTVPLDYNIDETQFSFISVSAMESQATVRELTELTLYHFGLQVHKDGLWSHITELSSKSVRTGQVLHADSIPNKISLLDLSFDETTNSIVVTWKVDTLGIGDKSLEAGIVWATSTYPKTDPSAVFGDRVVMSKPWEENSRALKLGENLVFDTLYYVALKLRVVNGAWADATDSSRGTVRIPSPKWQEVTYFRNTDTTSVFSRKVLLWKGPTWTSGVFDDTVDVFTPGQEPFGFIPVSIGVDFRYDKTSPPLYLGIRYDSIPAGFSASDINLYEFDKTNAVWRVLDRGGIDSLSKIVYTLLRPSEHKNPFMLMIDTFPPIISIPTDTASSVMASENVALTIIVSDNVANAQVELSGGKGADVLTLINQKRNTKCLDTTSFTIPSSMVTEDNGVRALFTINDGRFKKKIDVSRSVTRNASDQVTSLEEQWVPLSTTAILEDKTIEAALDELAEEGVWKYDSVYFRLFRYVSYSGNEMNNDKWVQYSENPDIRELFDFEPGRVIWLKTRYMIPIDLGKGTTVSLKDTTSVYLKAKTWTDFALPHKFSIRIGDIFQATGLQAPDCDSILFYGWDISKKQYFPVPIYDPGISYDFQDAGKDLQESYRTAYIIYNNLSYDIVLKIPPTPVALSSYAPAALPKNRAVERWSIAIRGNADGEEMTPVYCGYRKKFTSCCSGIWKCANPCF